MQYFTTSFRLVALCFLTAFCFNTNAQTTFQKSYGGTSEEYIYSTEQLSDGGYILCGRTITSTMNGSWDAYVVRLNSAGDTLWTKNYGNVGYDEFQSVKPTQDGGFIFCGQTDNVDAFADVYLVKTDALGVVTWSKAYGAAGTSDYGYSVRQTTDLGYIIAGLTLSAGAGGRDMVLIKTTSTGVVSWSKTYGGASDEEGRCVEETSDGYIIAGVTSSYGNGIQSYVVKTNATGVVTWSKTFGGSNTEYALSIKQTSDNGYVVAGYTDSYGAGNYDALLLKLTSAGVLSWAKTYGGFDIDIATSVKITSDGFVLAGRTTSFGGGNGDYYLIKTDASGVLTWSKAYGGPSLDQAYNVSQTTDGGYVITGYANSYGAGSKDGYVIKTDANGTSGCHEVTANTTTGTPTVTNGTGATEGTGLSAVNPTTARRKTTMDVGTQCFTSVSGCAVNASFTPSATTICAGTSVTFTNTTTGGAIGQGWYENNVLFSTAQSPTRTFSTAGTYTIQLISTNGTCQDTATGTITVNSNVTPSVSIVANTPSPICTGTCVTFTATPTSGGASPTYQWYIGSNPVGTNSATFQTCALANGNVVSVTMTSNAACASPTQVTSNTMTYVVTSTVTPSVTISTTTQLPLCGSAQCITFTATPVNGGTNPTYAWYQDNILIPNQTGNSVTICTFVPNPSNVYAILTSNNACASPLTATSNTIPVTIVPNVTPSVSITSNPVVPCPNTCVTFTATPINGGSNPGYQWYVNNAPVNGQTQSTFTTCTLPAGASVKVVLTSNALCASPTSATSNSISVSLPIATISADGPISFCLGDSVILTANPGSSYSWLPGSQTSQSITVTTAGNYTVTVTNANGCSATSAATPVTVNQPIAPSVSITVPLGGICPGACVTFTATPQNGGSTPTYQWFANATPVGTNSATYTTCTLNNGDVISVSMASSAACASPATVTSNTITQTVYPAPAQVVITQNGSTLTSSYPTGNQWYVVGNPTSVGNAQTYTVTQNGNYAVVYTDANGCQSSDTINVTNIGIAENAGFSLFNVYPNPSSGSITIEIETTPG